jgi:hypothetical protein
VAGLQTVADPTKSNAPVMLQAPAPGDSR